jgi:trans-aconitate methyltransferase
LVLALAGAGIDVVGIDRDEDMLRRAQSAVPLELLPRVRIERQDVTSLALPDRFRLAIVACNTFAQWNDREAEMALRQLRTHLHPGATLALDLPNPLDTARDALDDDEPVDAYIEPEQGRPIQVYAAQRLRPDGKVVDVQWSYDELLPDGHVLRRSYPVSYYLRSQEEVRGLLIAQGLRLQATYGDYARGAYKPHSPRMVMLARA